MDKYDLGLKKGVRSHTIFDNNYGIYGIFEDEKLIYIGYTYNSFLVRYSSHKTYIPYKKNKLYSKIRESLSKNKKVFLIPLITDKEINFKEYPIREIEKAMILKYLPICNREGIDIKYRDY